jgi:hypothetical protein
MAVEANMVKADVAAALLSMVWNMESNGLGATALAVFDCGTPARAGRAMLANGAVSHGVVELDIGLNVHCDLELVDGEKVGALAGDAWTAARTLADWASNALLLEAARVQLSALAERVLAFPAGEAEAAIRREARTGAQRVPVEATALLVGALVVVVARSIVGLGMHIPGRSGLLRGQSADNKRRRDTHSVYEVKTNWALYNSNWRRASVVLKANVEQRVLEYIKCK